ncbi:Epsin-3 [Nakaseomyces bracarensis]|uniref:Epsin-3 n=1 Tax=Nakaseomyces bracarensis TaxID=273131 RepID=A0ABR4NV17_9SACH
MSLEDTLSNLSLYDAKKYFRKAQNVMYNYTDIESKVREATNNEPWGASSTLMEQIAQGTYNIREREEILGMIFRRFTEKSGSEWRQIYKALQLLEYLIKHGSERFIDDTRSSISIIKLLESFHYIDSQGRDQGINVRNRAKALTELLSDDNKIRNERKKARETAKKYKGVAGGSASMGTGLPANTRAGFTSTKTHGISVSADFDSDEDDSDVYNRSSSRGGAARFRDTVSQGNSAQVSQSNSNEDFFSSNTNNNSMNQVPSTSGFDNDDDDDDDEFTEFHSAVPNVAPKESHSAQTQPASNIDLLAMDFNAPATVNPHKTNEIIPAIAENKKKDDPFSSLFSTAKTIKTDPIKPAVLTNTPAAPVAASIVSDDDDEFNELVSSKPQTQQTQPASNDGEIDLLSF